MDNMPIIGAKLKVTKGIYAGQIATVQIIANAPIPIGTTIPGQPYTIWFRPGEVETA